MTRQVDKKLLPIVIAAAVGGAALVFTLLYLLTGSVVFSVIPAILAAVLVGLLVLSRRAQKSLYAQAEGQPGAAAQVLGQLRGDWYKAEGVAGNASFDLVHRLVGRPGIVLVGEGNPGRVKQLIAQEKKRTARLAGEAPIYDVIVGREEGQVALGKLNAHLMKLPRNLSKEQVGALDRRLAALQASRVPLPQGPMPTGAKMRNVQRAARRRT